MYSERETEAKLVNVKKRIRFGQKTKVMSTWRYAAAACLIGLIGFGVYSIAIRKDRDVPIAETKLSDIQPGSQQATLKLSNDNVIVLGAGTDSIINDQVQIKDGAIVYNQTAGEVAQHEISIPRKGYYNWYYLTAPAYG